MNKTTTISALAVLAGLAIFDLGFREDAGVNEGSQEVASSRSPARGDEERRQRAPLSREEIVERLPKTLPLTGGTHLASGQSAQMAIFEKFGALEGEAAVDYIFQRYGKGQSAYLPMTYAMRGWLEADPDAAFAAFKGFLKNGKAGFQVSFTSSGLFEWKGESFHSGLT